MRVTDRAINGSVEAALWLCRHLHLKRLAARLEAMLGLDD